jgi:phage-related protein (TIGR01555 family)
MPTKKSPSPSPVRSKATPPSNLQTKGDGWGNVFTGMGNPQKDRRLATTFAAGTQKTEQELLYIYVEDGIGKKIIDIPCDDMMRQGFTVEGDTDGAVEKKLRSIGFKRNITNALKWASLNGGSIAVMGISDGQEYEMPVNESAIKDITHLHVFDRWRTSVPSSDLYNDPKDPKFGLPMVYNISPLSGNPFRVHETRVLRFEGTDVPEYVRQSNQGWGASDLEAVYERLRGIGEGYAGIEHIISEFIIGVFTINNLQELIATGREELVTKRLNLVDMSKHILNSILLDTNETYNRVSSAVGGLDGLMDKLVQALSAASGIPVTILMGESPAGLNATGASDVRRYYDMVKGRQEERLQEPLEKLVRYTLISLGQPAKEVQITFKPLWQPTEGEIVVMRKTQADSDAIYIDRNVLSADEVAAARFGGDQYSMETKLGYERDPSKEPELPPEPVTPPPAKGKQNAVDVAGVQRPTE